MSSLDLEKQLTAYGAYHHNKVNVFIHMICVPLLLFTGFELASNVGPFFNPPSWLSVPYLDPNLATFAAFAWGGLYVLLEPVAGTVLCVLCFLAAAVANYLRIQDSVLSNKISAGVHVAAWILQFLGHGRYEGRAPALLHNLFQALFLAPMFVWFELLFFLGYRAELKARVDKAVTAEIAKFREMKVAKKGKTA